jgi:hypothetical protein
VSAVFYAQKEDWPLAKLFFDENFPMKELGAAVQPFDTKYLQGYYFHETDVKWYESYPEVQEFERFVNGFTERINDEESPMPWMYEFVRIGENHEDIETTSDGDIDWLLSVERRIHTEFDLTNIRSDSDE